MKRPLLILLTIILSSILFLSACGSSNEEDSEGTEEEVGQEDSVETEENEETDEGVDESDAPDTTEGVEEETDETVDESETEDESNEEVENSETEETEAEVVEENETFRIFEPAPEASVDSEFTVRGEAQVNGGTVYYEFEDGHNILDEGSVAASAEAPDWGEFELTIQFDEVAFTSGTVILFEESDDGTRQNQLYLPVTVDE